MRARLQKVLEELRSSYWFIPAMMALAAVILAVALVQVDAAIGAEWLDSVPFLYASRPDGARQVLMTIGGSMIGVAGTVFSVTMLAVVYASGQYGPRLLTNFLADRGNQVTLGTFTATFLYAVMVLRTIRSPDETAGLAAGFVPNLAVFVGLVLALCSIAVLIFFIHYVPANIHISNVIAGIGRRLIHDIDAHFPATIGSSAQETEAVDDEAVAWQVPPPFRSESGNENGEPGAYGKIGAKHTGYIQFIDQETLFSAAREHSVVLRMQCRPGVFVHSGRPVIDVWPGEKLNPELAESVLSALATGARRTPHQDLLFQINELVEIAARALSPGVNDPFTAVTCIDWMGAALSEFAGRELSAPLRVDEGGKLRVIAPAMDFAHYLEQSLGSVRQYAASDTIAAAHILATLGQIALACRTSEQIEAVRLEGRRLLGLCETRMRGVNLENTQRKLDALNAELGHPRYRDLPSRMEDFLASPDGEASGEEAAAGAA